MFAILSAALLVLVTTGDDMLWLTPMMAQEDGKTAICVAFMATLQAAVWLCWIASMVTTGLVTAGGLMSNNTVIEKVAVGLCWILVIILFAKEVTKKRREGYSSLDTNLPLPPPTSNSMLIFTVASTTLIGAIDEFMYFPLLLMSHTYSVYQLSLGTLIASALILFLVTRVTSYPTVAKKLDGIKLHQIVLFFAIVMTYNTLY
eukprot:TRINITY_DN6140_c1_g1_i2.p1 TRINITY_DN6140_c1_g1~~TRINITY_DN6140_c1_g1_i2.p1  ORF type:complete len:219 (+),score=37.06 TRINITY_DN6140_c1_g1_i2:51-659(+)